MPSTSTCRSRASQNTRPPKPPPPAGTGKLACLQVLPFLRTPMPIMPLCGSQNRSTRPKFSNKQRTQFQPSHKQVMTAYVSITSMASQLVLDASDRRRYTTVCRKIRSAPFQLDTESRISVISNGVNSFSSGFTHPAPRLSCPDPHGLPDTQGSLKSPQLSLPT